VPVWHRATKKWRESGRLAVVGITQEQHPERCRLFKQWQGFEWPILWDPFNTTGAKVVPNFTLVDEHGIVRAKRVKDLASFEKDFLERTFEADVKVPKAAPVEPRLAKLSGPVGAPLEPPVRGALSAILWNGISAKPLAVLEQAAARSEAPSATQFALGVAYRMRWDSDARKPQDFQRALDAWGAALAQTPDQYIWRRRIQQYGPWLDKPYPFYDWVSGAMDAIRARGEEPAQLRSPLSGAELSRPSRLPDDLKEPDPDGKLPRAESGWFDVDSAVALDTKRKNPVARVHLVFRPGADSDAHWNNEAEPMMLWFSQDGVETSARWVRIDNAPQAVSSERRAVDLEVRFPDGATGKKTVRGYAVFNACSSAEGKCVFVRRDFEVPVDLP
jgi:hypothetical protein